jgi:hypothetical protein
MTITSTVNKNNYTGDGSQTIFSYTWLASSSSDIAVYLDDVVQASGFTTSGIGTASGGNVTFTTAPAAAVKVTLLRGIAYTQATDYTAYDPFPAETHESALDRGVIQAQQLLEKHDRTLKLKPSFSGAEIFVDAPTASKALAWDSTGTKIVNSTDDIDGITTAAAASATASATSATASATSATASATSATTSATSATTSATSAATSGTSATASASSATAAAASYDLFDDRYLGAKSSDPTLDNDGNALVDGAMFYDTTNNITKIYDLGTTTWLRTTPTASDQTKINTVSGISANVTTVAGISANVTTVAGISSDVTAVVADATDIGLVAGKSTEIGRLGTADAVADLAILGTADVVVDMNLLATASNVTAMGLLGTSAAIADMVVLGTADCVADLNTLGTTDCVADLNTLGTADCVADLNTLGTADCVADMNVLGTSGNVTNMNTLGTAGNVTNMNALGTAANVTNMGTLAGISSDITTVAANEASVQRYSDEYTISSSTPGSPSSGDLWYDTTGGVNQLKYYNGSAWIGIAPGITTEVDPNAAALALALG